MPDVLFDGTLGIVPVPELHPLQAGRYAKRSGAPSLLVLRASFLPMSGRL